MNVASRLLRMVSILACAVVVVSFALFVIDQTSSASHHQVAELSGASQSGPFLGTPGGATPSGQAAPVHRQALVRRTIDDVSSALTSPFRALISSGANPWAVHGIPALLALVLYGLGLGYLARVVRVRS